MASRSKHLCDAPCSPTWVPSATSPQMLWVIPSLLGVLWKGQQLEGCLSDVSPKWPIWFTAVSFGIATSKGNHLQPSNPPSPSYTWCARQSSSLGSFTSWARFRGLDDWSTTITLNLGELIFRFPYQDNLMKLLAAPVLEDAEVWVSPLLWWVKFCAHVMWGEITLHTLGPLCQGSLCQASFAIATAWEAWECVGENSCQTSKPLSKAFAFV